MFENPIALVGRLPRTVRLLVYGTLVNKLGTFILPYLSLVLSRDFHMPAREAGALIAAYGLGSLVSIISGGVLTDRLGRRRTLMLSLFGSGSLAVLMGFSPSSRIFVPILLLYGFLSDLYRPASSAIIGDLLPSEQRATGFAALRVAVNLGFAFGSALGGWLVDWSWRFLFISDGLTTVLFGLIVLRLIPETRRAASGIDASQDAGDSPWRDWVFIQLLICSCSFAVVVFSCFTVLPLTVTQSAGYSASTYGALIGTNGVVIALTEISLVAWLRRFRRLRVAAVGFALAGIGLALVGFVMHWLWLLLTILFWTVGEILALPQQMAFATDWAPERARGRYLGMWGATWSIGFMINPILLLPLHAVLPERLFWPILLAILLPAIFILRRLDRVADRPDLLRGRRAAVAASEPAIMPAISPDA